MVDKNLKLRTAIADKLKNILPDVYYSHAPDGAGLPRAVFLIDTIEGEDGMLNADLSIDIADIGTDDTALETCAGKIQEALDYEVYFDEGIAFESYADTRSRIDENEKNIMRVRLTFNIRAY